MERLITAEFRRTQLRFDSLKEYVEISQKKSEHAAAYQSHLFRSWILLFYADVEAAITGLLLAFRSYIGRYMRLDELPSDVASKHISSTLQVITREIKTTNVASSLRNLNRALSSEWYCYSELGKATKNVRHEHVKSLLSHLSANDEEISLLESERSSGGYLCHRRLDRLVDDRNAIAHGAATDQLLSMPQVLEWIDDVCKYIETLRILLTHVVVRLSPASLGPCGIVDATVKGLSRSTIPFERVLCTLVVGDPVIVQREGDKSLCVARLLSLQSNGQKYERVESSYSRVAASLSKSGPFLRVLACP